MAHFFSLWSPALVLCVSRWTIQTQFNFAWYLPLTSDQHQLLMLVMADDYFFLYTSCIF